MFTRTLNAKFMEKYALLIATNTKRRFAEKLPEFSVQLDQAFNEMCFDLGSDAAMIYLDMLMEDK